jgi:hypothetical protein
VSGLCVSAVFALCVFTFLCLYIASVADVLLLTELERDRVKFDKRLQSELAERDAYLESLQRQLETLTTERTAREGRLLRHNSELGASLNTVERKLLLLTPFDPLRQPALAALNLPPHARPHRLAQQALCVDLAAWLVHISARFKALAKPLAIKVFLPHLLPLQTHAAHLNQQQTQSAAPSVTIPELRMARLQALLSDASTLESLESEAAAHAREHSSASATVASVSSTSSGTERAFVQDYCHMLMSSSDMEGGRSLCLSCFLQHRP